MKILLLSLMFLVSGCALFDREPEACEISEADKDKVLNDVWLLMDKNYSGHSQYCKVGQPASKFNFYQEKKGLCRIYLPCAESPPGGGMLLHGDWIIEFDIESLGDIKFYDVAW